MESEEILRPTPERLRHSDHLADDGAPTKEQPYVRPQRLGSAWDRYSRTRDGEGNLLPIEKMILNHDQIEVGKNYITAAEGSDWGYPGGTKLEPSTPTGRYNLPAAQIDRGLALRSKEAKLSPRYLVSLVRAVLLEGHSADTWAGATGRHPKSGIELLRLALDQMADN